MFEELRGLPPKPEKTYTKKQKGCFKFSYGFLFVLLALIIGFAITLSSINGEGFKKYKELADALKVEVSEEEMAPNKVAESDFVEFEGIINASVTNTKGLDFFDNDHNMILESFMAEDLVFHNNITLGEKLFACFCSDVLQANIVKVFETPVNKDALSLIEIDLNTVGTKTFVRGVLKLNPEKLFENYASYKEKYGFASTFYVISTFCFDNMTNEIETAHLQVNKLSEENNNLLLSILAGKKQLKNLWKCQQKRLWTGLMSLKKNITPFSILKINLSQQY